MACEFWRARDRDFKNVQTRNQFIKFNQTMVHKCGPLSL